MRKRLLSRDGLGSLKKIGFITPSSNTALEPLTAMMFEPVGDLVSVHCARLSVRTLTLDPADVGQFQTDSMLAAARLLADAEVDAIIWNGTSGAWSGEGLDIDREICESITRHTGIAASTSSLAQVEAFRKYGVRRYGLAVPYVEGPTAKMLASYEKEGFHGIRQARLDETVNVRVGRTTFERLRQLLRDADHPEADCLMVGCTNLPATVLLDEMEHELGKPVLDSIAVTAWHALAMAGVDRPIHGWGMLLRDHPVINALQEVMQELLHECKASRTTIRLDVPEHNIHCDDVYAEATAPGVAPLKLDSSLNQRSLGTVRWLEANRRLLVQDDCVNSEVPPPAALMNVYGVKAQVLGPILAGDHMMGWISVHHIPGTRTWTDTELNALERALKRARSILEQASWLKAQA
ncbi:aspartate/glutamate racemase family protein [Pigmentiphaga soli]|uniref:Aspartate/glutamate racemase family protein n=1 Tax=Pigmentiphaga soli TaxID=1007095 RepID=A0ABP8HNJ3_9BURK